MFSLFVFFDHLSHYQRVDTAIYNPNRSLVYSPNNVFFIQMHQNNTLVWFLLVQGNGHVFVTKEKLHNTQRTRQAYRISFIS